MQNLKPTSVARLLILAVISFLPPPITHARDSRWALRYEERFDHPFNTADHPWSVDASSSVDVIGDDGPFFHWIGGPAFDWQRKTFKLRRQSIAFGQDGWLTAELSARDTQDEGPAEARPTFHTGRLPTNDPAGFFEVPGHQGGILIRSTRPLPEVYRMECRLRMLAFGGSRKGQWTYDGRTNGYQLDKPKTNHPWPWGPTPLFQKPYAQWQDVHPNNGFYFLTIVDYAGAAPHNNVFIHGHRKVGIDTYNVESSTGEVPEYQTCNPVTRTYYHSNDNTVNMIFFSTGTPLQSGTMMETACGTAYGGEDGHSSVVTAGQMQPEFLPDHSYTFAIERTKTSYTLEVHGLFRYVGETTFRYTRSFVQDGRPIWHYNQTSDYDGRFDSTWTYSGPFGTSGPIHSWPKGSAYPDTFIIGDPHINYYEGSAAIDLIRLYTEKKS